MSKSLFKVALLALSIGLCGNAYAEMTNIGLDLPVIHTGHVLTPGAFTAGDSVLYCPSEADDVTLRDGIAALTGAVCDYFDPRVATPDVATLAAYSAVITWANFAYLDNVALGDNLAAYVDGGGRVLLCQWTLPTAGNFLGGAIMDQAGPYVPCTAAGATYTFADYSLLNGAGDCLLDGGYGVDATLSSNYRDNITDNANGTIQAGTWSDGQSIHAQNDAMPGFVDYYAGVPSYSFSTGTINEAMSNWLKDCGGPPNPCVITGFACSVDCAAGEVSLSWDANPNFDSLELDTPGGIVALLGSDTSYVDMPGDGTWTYTLTSACSAAGSSPASRTCTVDLFSAGLPANIIIDQDLGGQIDSVAAITTAMDTAGKGYIVVSSLDDLPCGGAGALTSDNTVWYMGGTYPENGVVSASHGTQFVTHVQNGGDLFVEGSDIWGFDAQTDLQLIDGIVDGASADGDDSFVAMTGIDFDAALLAGYDAAYNQDQAGTDYTDQLAVAGTGESIGGTSGAVFQDTTQLYTTSVFVASDAPNGQVWCQGWEFGGYGGNQDDLLGAIQAAFGGGGVVIDAFVRGDANDDGNYDISDAVFTLSALFVLGSPLPTCADAADSNDDGGNDISDAVYTLSALFVLGSPLPPAPHPACGADPTADGLDCAAYTHCP